jgi:HNH endonuclease/NUMOD4 motif-containing protein
MREVWKAAVGYEGVYEVSSLGRVKRVLRNRGLNHHDFLKPFPVGEYLGFKFCVDGVRKTVYAHDLVAAAFIGPKPKKATVNHKDLDKGNNAETNLEYTTRAGNYWHARKRGITFSCKVTRAQANEMRRLRGKVTLTELSAKYGITPGAISAIQLGKYQTVPEPKDYHDV